jgi:beta-carotene 15,15'-dioxygenase
VTSPTVFTKTRQLSVAAVLAVVVLSVLGSLLFGSSSAEWQVWLAVAALAVGIPHGALDHLVTVPSMEPKKMTFFVSAYLGVVAVVVAALFAWPVGGFVFVVVMSAVHFGMGDACFVRQEKLPFAHKASPWWVYAIPAGAIPVVIPLTSQGSSDALTLVNPVLVTWHFGFDQVLFWASVAAGVVAIVWLAATRRIADARDLAVLGLLALATPPLIAFAAYFGLWHALRHTARLSDELAPAKTAAGDGRWVLALWRVSVPGLPALVGTLVVAAAMTAIGGWAVEEYLWVALVLVWALTVPHMALTWRLDKRVLVPVDATPLSR